MCDSWRVWRCGRRAIYSPQVSTHFLEMNYTDGRNRERATGDEEELFLSRRGAAKNEPFQSGLFPMCTRLSLSSPLLRKGLEVVSYRSRDEICPGDFGWMVKMEEIRFRSARHVNSSLTCIDFRLFYILQTPCSYIVNFLFPFPW